MRRFNLFLKPNISKYHLIDLMKLTPFFSQKYGIFTMPIYLDLIQHIDVVTVSTWEPAINSAVQLKYVPGSSHSVPYYVDTHH